MRSDSNFVQLARTCMWTVIVVTAVACCHFPTVAAQTLLFNQIDSVLFRDQQLQRFATSQGSVLALIKRADSQYLSVFNELLSSPSWEIQGAEPLTGLEALRSGTLIIQTPADSWHYDYRLFNLSGTKIYEQLNSDGWVMPSPDGTRVLFVRVGENEDFEPPRITNLATGEEIIGPDMRWLMGRMFWFNDSTLALLDEQNLYLCNINSFAVSPIYSTSSRGDLIDPQTWLYSSRHGGMAVTIRAVWYEDSSFQAEDSLTWIGAEGQSHWTIHCPAVVVSAVRLGNSGKAAVAFLNSPQNAEMRMSLLDLSDGSTLAEIVERWNTPSKSNTTPSVDASHDLVVIRAARSRANEATLDVSDSDSSFVLAVDTSTYAVVARAVISGVAGVITRPGGNYLIIATPTALKAFTYSISK